MRKMWSQNIPQECQSSSAGDSKQSHFNSIQARTLVENWVTSVKKLESIDSLKYWKVIQGEVDKVGSPKTIAQIKKKIALNKSYKDVNTNNSKSGRARMAFKFYAEIDSILSTRDVVLMPAAKSFSILSLV